jgi:hypothetical protein
MAKIKEIDETVALESPDVDGAAEAGAEVEPPRGRAAILEEYRAANPDDDEPDDEALFEFTRSRYGDLDGKYKNLSGANTRLAERVSKDPRLGAFISLVAGDEPKSVPYAAARTFGKEVFELDDEALEDFEKGYQEQLKELASSEAEREQARKNIEKYNETLVKYGEENKLEEAALGEVHQAIMELADNILMGNIPPDLIDLIAKGLNHDKDVQEAVNTGFVEGKNERIDAKLKPAAAAKNIIPDLAAGTGAGTPKKSAPPRRRSFFDAVEEIPGSAPRSGPHL